MSQTGTPGRPSFTAHATVTNLAQSPATMALPISKKRKARGRSLGMLPFGRPGRAGPVRGKVGWMAGRERPGGVLNVVSFVFCPRSLSPMASFTPSSTSC